MSERDRFEQEMMKRGQFPDVFIRNQGKYVIEPLEYNWLVWQAAIQAERERCAKIAHKLAYGSGTADAIRRGGEHDHNE